jgi:hypothetical protein
VVEPVWKSAGAAQSLHTEEAEGRIHSRFSSIETRGSRIINNDASEQGLRVRAVAAVSGAAADCQSAMPAAILARPA